MEDEQGINKIGVKERKKEVEDMMRKIMISMRMIKTKERT